MTTENTVATKLLAVFGPGALTAVHNANGVSFSNGMSALSVTAQDKALTPDLKKDPGTYTVQLSEDGTIEQVYIEPPAAPAGAKEKPKAAVKQSADFGFTTRQAR